MTVPELPEDEYTALVDELEQLLIRRAGWHPPCVPCWLRNAVDTRDVANFGPTLEVRFATLGGGEPDGYIPPHVDVMLKCPECQYHQHHGLRLDDNEYDALADLLPDGGRFDAAAMITDEKRDDRLRALGYLD